MNFAVVSVSLSKGLGGGLFFVVFSRTRSTWVDIWASMFCILIVFSFNRMSNFEEISSIALSTRLSGTRLDRFAHSSFCIVIVDWLYDNSSSVKICVTSLS